MDPTQTTVLQDNTIPYALAGILEQTRAQVVVVRVDPAVTTPVPPVVTAPPVGRDPKSAPNTSADPAPPVTTALAQPPVTNLLAQLTATADHLLGAESVVHATPRILIAPGFQMNAASAKTMADHLGALAKSLRGIAIVDAPDGQAEAISLASDVANPRVYMVSPQVKVATGSATRTEAASARVAGVIARSDAERGFWWSPSNQTIAGISGTSRAIAFSLGDPTSSANALNAGKVATIIHQDGYRLWGNRTTASDVKWAFLSVRRTADLINDSLLDAHAWAVDRNITKTYVADVTEGVNAFLRHLKSIGAIIDGTCWADVEINSPDQITQGRVTFDFDFTPPYPAEHITFRSSLVNRYLEEIFA